MLQCQHVWYIADGGVQCHGTQCMLRFLYWPYTVTNIFSFSVKFYGCQPYPGPTACCPDNTIDATNVASYRHFSVDTFNNIIYFCDYRSYQEGIYCYWTQRDPLNPNSNVWTELPRYVSSIIGYDSTGGKYKY